jgi:hypothetical protein
MLRELIDIKNEKTPTFQVMLLRNDSEQEVEVHEAENIDFQRIQEHLKQGGSVFITSKCSQKLSRPSLKQRHLSQKRRAMRTVTAFYFDHT